MNYYLGHKCLNPSILDIPTKLTHAPSNSTKRVTIFPKVVQVVLIVSCLVQPCSSPKQLILHTHPKIKSIKTYHTNTIIAVVSLQN